MNALDNSRIGIAAQALGIAQGAYEAALTYAHERRRSGHRSLVISSSQATWRTWQLGSKLRAPRLQRIVGQDPALPS